MVMPERLVPGDRDSAWAQPMASATFHDMSRTVRVRRP